MKKIFVIPNSYELLGSVLKKDIDGVILPLEHLSVNHDISFSLEDIKVILNTTSKEIAVSINKIMHNSDLKFLEEALISLNKMNVSKIFFYDLAVLNICRKLEIKKDLVVFQDHLNTSYYSNLFYHQHGVKYSVISNDITIEEINKIGKELPLMIEAYGYVPIFYSRRYLITNYLKYICREKDEGHYYIKNKENRYPIVEEEYGTTIYTKEPINLINDVKNLEVDAIILNSLMIDKDLFLKVVDQYVTFDSDNEDHYSGFLHEKTVYRVGDMKK